MGSHFNLNPSQSDGDGVDSFQTVSHRESVDLLSLGLHLPSPIGAPPSGLTTFSSDDSIVVPDSHFSPFPLNARGFSFLTFSSFSRLLPRSVEASRFSKRGTPPPTFLLTYSVLTPFHRILPFWMVSSVCWLSAANQD